MFLISADKDKDYSREMLIFVETLNRTLRFMKILRTFDLLDNLKQYAPKDDILSVRVKGQWIKYSIDDYIRLSHTVAYGLLSLGLSPGAKVITICNNRPEWNFVDMGANLARMVHVPVYGTLGTDEFRYIFNHSDAEVIFIGNAGLYKRIAPIVQEIKRKIHIILMDDSTEVYCFKELLEAGKRWEKTFASVVEGNKRNIASNECASIVYTSGTTGNPKGVMLSHYNLMFNSHGHAIRQTKNHTHKMVSFLPLCHVYERTMNYEYQELGISIYYAESLATVASDLKDCQADGFCAVPRVLNLMYGKFEDAGRKLTGIKGKIYAGAWKFANNFDNYNHNPLYLLRQKLWDKLVYSKWRENLGGKEMLVVSGGSSIQAKIVRTFNAAKLHIFEGYGMTETSPVIAVNSPADGYNVIGTVGKRLEGTELSFAPDGEILTRGPHVMLGYYKDPEATAQAIDADGWMHTGDIGTLVDGEYLKITDRKKEIFKLSSGKYVAPQVVETLLNESEYIDSSFVVGANQTHPAAIIVPNFNALRRDTGATGPDEKILTLPAVQKILKDEVDAVNNRLAAHETIKRYKLVADSWSVDNGLLSQTLKLKRRNLLARYQEVIEELFK